MTLPVRVDKLDDEVFGVVEVPESLEELCSVEGCDCDDVSVTVAWMDCWELCDIVAVGSGDEEPVDDVMVRAFVEDGAGAVLGVLAVEVETIVEVG